MVEQDVSDSGSEEDDEVYPEVDLSGTELDRYRLVRRLGQGGMGAVYEAKHTVLGTRVAIKLLRPELATHKRARRRFLREAKVAARVEHPNIVALTDFGEQPEVGAFFVMEYLEGHDLGVELKRSGPMTWDQARPIVLQIVSALEASHAHGVLHRDVKPSNCFLVRREPGAPALVKVLDFGIARVSSAEEDTEPITNTGQVLGTVGYMAPEVFKGMNDEPRSDIYSMGVLLYRMLIGEAPFTGNVHYVVLQHMRAEPTQPRRRRPTIPESVERIILQAMAKRPEDRFATMSALREALDATPLGEAPEGSSAGTTSDGRPSRARLLWIMVALGGAAAVGAALLYEANEQPPAVVPVRGEVLDPDQVGPQPPAGSTTDALAGESGTTTSGSGGEVDEVSGVASGPASSTSASERSLAPDTTGAEAPAPRKSRPRPSSRPTNKPAPPRTDDQVIQQLRRTLVRKCGKGTTSYKVEGQILSTGKVLTVIVDPSADKADCIERIVKRAQFASDQQRRRLPTFHIAL